MKPFLDRILFYVQEWDEDLYCCKGIHSTESSWEVSSHLEKQDIHKVLSRPQICHEVHKSLLLVPILTQLNLTYILITSLISNLILSSHPSLDIPSSLLPSGLSNKNIHVYYFLYVYYMAHTEPSLN